VPLVGTGAGKEPKEGRSSAEAFAVCGLPSGPSAPCRPLRLWPRPVEIAATSLVPDGPPIAFRFQGVQHAVAARVGPERIETGWWRGPHVKRDYYRVTTDAGRRCWLFRDREKERWFLHGWFD